jgi:hypothetical protein
MTMQAPFKPSDYVEAIRGKIRSAMVDVIPDERWDEMVKAEVERFFDGKDVRVDNWGNTVRTTTGFKELVQKLLAEEVSARMRAYFSSPEWTARWSGGHPVASEKVAEIVKEHAPEIIGRWLGAAVQSAITGMAGYQPR